MSMLKQISTRLTVALACSGALAACGDNIKDTNTGPPDAHSRPDAASIDSTPIDGPPTPTVGGTIALTDVTVLDAAGQALGLSGGVVNISFSDLTMNGGTHPGGFVNPVNGCLLTEYDPTHLPNPSIDGGPILVTDDTTHSGGLTRTIGPCGFSAQAGNTYVCESNAAANQAVTAVGNNATAAGTVVFQFSGTPFTGENVQGSYVVIGGFANAHYNGQFPIVAQPAPMVLVVADPAGTADAAEPAASGINYAVFNGVAPVPGGSDYFAGGGGSTGNPGPSVHIHHDATAVWPVIDTSVDVVGQGWALDNPSAVTSFPLGSATVAAQTYGCSTNCGDTSSALVQAMIISGSATKKSLAGLAPFQMPPEVPGTDTWMTWQCAFIGSSTATMPAAAVQAIHDFQPTRVEIQVINAAGAILQSGPGNVNQTNLLVGHAFVGHTTAP